MKNKHFIFLGVFTFIDVACATGLFLYIYLTGKYDFVCSLLGSFIFAFSFAALLAHVHDLIFTLKGRKNGLHK